MALDADVATALLARAGSLSHGAPVMPKAMPDVAFTPPTKPNGEALPYFRVDLFRNEPFWSSVGGRSADQGLLQITVVWPKGAGVIKASAAADAVRAHFPKALRLTHGAASVKIGQAWATGPIPSSTQTETPVAIPWRAA